MAAGCQDADSDRYVLQRNYLSSCRCAKTPLCLSYTKTWRLTGQHNFMIWRNGWLLHPTVKKYLDAQPRKDIVDVGTGNSIWAPHPHDEYPEAQLLGLDISVEQFPSPWTRPENVKFGSYNVLSSVPDHLSECFDVVHLRLLSGAFGPADIQNALRNVFKMLKPGGFMQWQDVIYPFWATTDRTLKTSEDLAEFMQLLDQCYGGRFSSSAGFSWTPLFSETDFSGVDRYDLKILPHLLGYETDYAQWAMQEAITKVRSSFPEAAKQSLLDATERKLADFTTGGGYITYNTAVFVAQKPA